MPVGSLKNNVTISNKDNVTYVTYYSTDIVKFDENTVTLNAGCYMSASTKAKINAAAQKFSLSIQVFQSKGKWIVKTNKGEIEFKNNMIIER